MHRHGCQQSLNHLIIHTCTGALIGTLPTEQHQVSGKFYVVDSKTLFFEDFDYDGGGPGKKILYYFVLRCVKLVNILNFVSFS